MFCETNIKYLTILVVVLHSDSLEFLIVSVSTRTLHSCLENHPQAAVLSVTSPKSADL